MNYDHEAKMRKLSENAFYSIPNDLPRWIQVKVIYPFGGAAARVVFIDKENSKNIISTYLDVNNALGYMSAPYFEIHPSRTDNDTERFLTNQTNYTAKNSFIDNSFVKSNLNNCNIVTSSILQDKYKKELRNCTIANSFVAVELTNYTIINKRILNYEDLYHWVDNEHILLYYDHNDLTISFNKEKTVFKDSYGNENIHPNKTYIARINPDNLNEFTVVWNVDEQKPLNEIIC